MADYGSKSYADPVGALIAARKKRKMKPSAALTEAARKRDGKVATVPMAQVAKAIRGLLSAGKTASAKSREAPTRGAAAGTLSAKNIPNYNKRVQKTDEDYAMVQRQRLRKNR